MHGCQQASSADLSPAARRSRSIASCLWRHLHCSRTALRLHCSCPYLRSMPPLGPCSCKLALARRCAASRSLSWRADRVGVPCPPVHVGRQPICEDLRRGLHSHTPPIPDTKWIDYPHPPQRYSVRDASLLHHSSAIASRLPLASAMSDAVPAATDARSALRLLVARKDDLELQLEAISTQAHAGQTLVDADGFPRADLDVHAIRNARAELASQSMDSTDHRNQGSTRGTQRRHDDGARVCESLMLLSLPSACSTLCSLFALRSVLCSQPCRRTISS